MGSIKLTPRRMCFDTASNWFLRLGWLDGPDAAREYFRTRPLKFHAATVFDEADRQFHDFTNSNDLFAFLCAADEIITFNGRKCDLIVLEHAIGADEVGALWRKPHHDLTGWQHNWSLTASVQAILPERASGFKAMRHSRREALRATDHTDFHADHLAGTYRDTAFTYALFEAYRARGGSDRTFRDLDARSA